MSIVLSDVSYTYMAKTPFERIAIKGIDLTIGKGEFVAIIGHTGSGKSTLIQHLNGLLRPMSGKVTVEGQDIHRKDAAAKMAKRKVGMVFQYPEHQLFEETIYDDIAFGPRNIELSEDEVERRVMRAMEFVDLNYAMYKERSPFQLSGGQMRRVAIAGVIALEPEYLILDEPSAGLDPCGRDSIYSKIKKLYQETKITVILVSHNMDDVARLANRVIVMSHGEVMMDACPTQVFRQADVLRAAGVDVPQMALLLETLKSKGISVNADMLDLEGSIQDILRAVRGEKQC